jgi:hypothetical protein
MPDKTLPTAVSGHNPAGLATTSNLASPAVTTTQPVSSANHPPPHPRAGRELIRRHLTAALSLVSENC